MLVQVNVTGPFACFTRPEMSVERVSYGCMTPTAAEGILSAIYHKPEFDWVVTEIVVHNPVTTQTVRVNEIKNIIMPGDGKGVEDRHLRTQRYMVMLTDVNYTIKAKVKLLGEVSDVNNVQKHINVFNKRVEKGACFYRPFLGMSSFPAYFKPSTNVPPINLTQNLGMMPLQITNRGAGAKTQVYFFQAQLTNGVLTVPSRNNEVMA